jgi:peptide deformylase
MQPSEPKEIKFNGPVPKKYKEAPIEAPTQAPAAKQESIYSYLIDSEDPNKLKVILYPNPILSERTTEVKEEDMGILRYAVPKMFKLLYKTSGVGLAANQVGQGLRFFIMNEQAIEDKEKKRDDPEYDSSDNELVFVNPVIIEQEGEQVSNEGCLSLPSFVCNVGRRDRVVVEALDMNYEKFTKEFTGFAAAIIQHEIDHLDGILIESHAAISEVAMQKGVLGSLKKGYDTMMFLSGRGDRPKRRIKKSGKKAAPKKRPQKGRAKPKAH